MARKTGILRYECPQCGKVWKTEPSLIEGTTHVFCGTRCAVSWYVKFHPEDAICDKCRGPVDPDTSVFTENSDLLCGGCKEEG